MRLCTRSVPFIPFTRTWSRVPARRLGHQPVAAEGRALLTNNDSFRRRHWGLERLVVGVRNVHRVVANVLEGVNTQYWRRRLRLIVHRL